MANAFTGVRGWRYAGSNMKSILKIEGTLVIDTTGGAVAGDLPAALFGLNQVIGHSVATLSDNSKVYTGVPAYDGNSLLITDGAAQVPINLPNGTYKVCIEGYAA